MQRDTDNPNPPARPVHGGIKEAELRALGLRLEDCLDFSASVSPLGPPEGVAETIAAVDLTAYPDPHCLALTEAIAAHHAGEGVTDANVIVGNGSTEIIHLLTRAWIGAPPAGCAPGALLLTPTYGEYDGAVRISGGSVVALTAIRCSEGFAWDTSVITAAIDAERPALTFVCNPNNPTGVLMGREQLAEIADAVANTGGLLVVDEAYINLSERRADADVIELAAQHGSVIALRSMTKDYALTALRLGYAVAAAPVIARLAALQPDWSVNGLAQAAGLVAIADEAYLERARQAVVASHDCVVERLTALGIRCYPAEANFVLAQVGDAADLRDRLARRGLFVRDCTSFGLPDCIRIGLRPVADCIRLADAIADIWNQSPQP
ncbi:MAG: histidinol-phosphate transaminase [Chloroflexota bacterium]|nr:histidinol-phosphate transaminase [Chloroflexota bacterium]MDE2961016.1 histidinol-phosphate transaminase [Chloroflexota bacterium]